MVDLGEDEEKFDAFMIPLTQAFENLGQVLLNTNNSYNTEEVRKTVIGLARDLRGIAFAFNTKTSYMMLFDWIYPAYTPILQRAVEIWYQDPQVTTPVLKLFAELVQNRSQRLQFDVSSPNGILLFREASKIICTYGKKKPKILYQRKVARYLQNLKILRVNHLSKPSLKSAQQGCDVIARQTVTNFFRNSYL
jgi:exportin-7